MSTVVNWERVAADPPAASATPCKCDCAMCRQFPHVVGMCENLHPQRVISSLREEPVKPSLAGDSFEAAAIKYRQLDRDIGDNGSARHSLHKLWIYVTTMVDSLVHIGTELKGNEATLCIVTPPCGNCSACRFNAAMERLSAARK